MNVHSQWKRVVRRLDLLEQQRRRRLVERKMPEHHHVQHHAQRPDVNRFAHVRPARQHLGRNVRGRTALIQHRIAVRLQVLAQTEVRDGDAIRVLVQHDIAQLQVAMDDVALVEFLHHRNDIAEYHQSGDIVHLLHGDQVLLQIDVGLRSLAELVRPHAVQHENDAPVDATGVPRLGLAVDDRLLLLVRVVRQQAMRLDDAPLIGQHRQQREFGVQQHFAVFLLQARLHGGLFLVA